MMGSMGGVRRNIFQAALAVLLALASVTTSHAAVFDDGNDRKFVKDLREKSPANLTDEEKAILVAANKVGLIRLCNGRSGGNAFFINYGGRPAVLTSGHIFVDRDKEQTRCAEEQARKAFYYPNASYYDPNRREVEYPLKRIPLVYPPINLREINGHALTPTDWLVFLMEADIAQDSMPGGSTRGSLSGPTEQADAGKLTMIGVAPDFENADRTLYQQSCDYVVRNDFVYHNCDTINGSSGSMLGVYERGEIKVRGVHNFAVMGDDKLPQEFAELDALWNAGALIETILAGANEPLTEFLAYDIQLRLSRAGCYSGKLDNQWGPASRKALAAFAAAVEIGLPGTEPSPELLATVEKTAPEGTEVCRR